MAISSTGTRSDWPLKKPRPHLTPFREMIYDRTRCFFLSLSLSLLFSFRSLSSRYFYLFISARNTVRSERGLVSFFYMERYRVFFCWCRIKNGFSPFDQVDETAIYVSFAWFNFLNSTKFTCDSFIKTFDFLVTLRLVFLFYFFVFRLSSASYLISQSFNSFIIWTRSALSTEFITVFLLVFVFLEDSATAQRIVFHAIFFFSYLGCQNNCGRWLTDGVR